jgi:methionyl aminopeptidase
MPKIRLKSSRDLDIMAQAGAIVADTLVLLKELAVPGVTTRELNERAVASLAERGAVSSYPAVGFDGVVCTSINEQVVHGIPGPRILRAGDIVGLDIAAIFGGYHADAAITVPVGCISAEAQHLLAVTEQALSLGLSLCTPGRYLHDIGAAIQLYVESHGCSVVRGLVGHGIGRSMWEEPQVPNYRQETRGPVLRPGMVFTIEPMVNAGRFETEVLADKWTIATKDRSLSAHFEHTVAVQANGPRVLTVPDTGAQAWALQPPVLDRSIGAASVM